MSQLNDKDPFRALCRVLVDNSRGKDFETVLFHLLSDEAKEEIEQHNQQVGPVWYFSIHSLDWTSFKHGEEMNAIYQWVNCHSILARLAEGSEEWKNRGHDWVSDLELSWHCLSYFVGKPLKEWEVDWAKWYSVFEFLNLVGKENGGEEEE